MTVSKANQNKPHVALISPFPPPNGGIANWSLLVKQQLDREKYPYQIINIAPKSRFTDGRGLFQRITDGFATTFGAITSLNKLYSCNQVEVIHLCTSGSLAFLRDFFIAKWAESHKVPIAYHLHFGRVPEILVGQSWEKELLKRVLKSVDIVIVLDGKTEDSLKSFDSSVRVTRIGNPVDCSYLRTLSREDSPDRRIEYVGWIIKEKGIFELIEAWKCVHSRYPNWILELVGPYNENDDLYQHIKSLPKEVVLCGELDHDAAMKRLSSSAALVLPSHTEAFPNVILEAMALSKPVIATDVGAITEMVPEDSGIVIPVSNASALADAMISLIEDDIARRRMGANGNALVKQKFDLTRVVNSYEACWTSLCFAERDAR